MPTLIGDRFVCNRSISPKAASALHRCRLRALDLASGRFVRIRIDAAGSRAEQRSWSEACLAARSEGTLVDFGFIGASLKFEADGRPDDAEKVRRISDQAVLEWLRDARPSSRRILYLNDLPDPRDLRLGGFIPCSLSLLLDRKTAKHAFAVIGGRSVALLDVDGVRSHVALTVLRLRLALAREVCVFAPETGKGRGRVSQAAESRAIYDGRSSAVDARSNSLLIEGRRQVEQGRHAAAERTLRAAACAFDRRSDRLRAGHATLELGRLLLGRGRAADARAEFERSAGLFQNSGAVGPALEASTCLALAETDLNLFAEGELTCRAALTAATAGNLAESAGLAVAALARNLIWQKRYADARSVLESIEPHNHLELRARHWCLRARLSLASDAFSDASRALRQARPRDGHCTPAIEALVRTWEGAVQARLGDLDALRIHIRAGLESARVARQPIRAVILRLVYIQGLATAGRPMQAQAMAKHLASIRAAAIPPVLRGRIAEALTSLRDQDGRGTSRVLPASVRESLPRFEQGQGGTRGEDLDGLRDVLSLSHQVENESEVLMRTAAAIRRHTHAAGVGIFGWKSGDVRLIAEEGASRATLAQRSVEIGQAIGPERDGRWIDSAMPIQYLGRTIGAIAMRWNPDGPENVERAMAFGSASAMACAPLVYVLLEQEGTPANGEAGFDLIGVSEAIEEVRKAIRRAANAPFTVLIEGESGSGKELVARAIHRAGRRRERRFCALNCAAMPEDLVDAELFGYAKGAFTGAVVERVGLFESADGGTVFLDEVGEMSARAQAKMLRVLQEGEIRRIGENFTRTFDARLVAATNRSLRAEAAAGRFRQDLLYRLDVIRIVVPPLRERVEDIPLLAVRFWRQVAERIGSKAVLGQGTLAALARYDWPGNVRELQNALTALAVGARPRGVVCASELPAAIARAVQHGPSESLETARAKFEERFVRAALARSAGHRGHTAAALGLSRQGLAKLMQRLQLDA